MPDHGCGPRMKNGPALAGHGADAVRDAIARTITTLPELLRQSLTWDQGAEMAQHSQLTIAVLCSTCHHADACFAKQRWPQLVRTQFRTLGGR